MQRLSLLSRLIRRLPGDDKGAVAIIFGLMIIPLVLAIGVGVDYARAVQFKAQLQSATDSAALAGASPWLAPMPPEIGARTFDVLKDFAA